MIHLTWVKNCGGPRHNHPGQVPASWNIAGDAQICGQCQVDDHIHVGNAKGCVLFVCFILGLLLGDPET